MSLTMDERIDKMKENLLDYKKRVKSTITKLNEHIVKIEEYAANLEVENSNLEKERENSVNQIKNLEEKYANLQSISKDQQEKYQEELDKNISQVEQKYQPEIKQLRFMLALHKNKSAGIKNSATSLRDVVHPALNDDESRIVGSPFDKPANNCENLLQLSGSKADKTTKNRKKDEKTLSKEEIKPKSKRRRLFNTSN